MRVVYGFTGCRGDGVPYLVDVYFAGLPDELYVGVLPDDVKAGGQGAVNGTCPEAAAQYQDSLFGRVQAEVAYGFFVRNGMSEQVLADGVAGHDNLLCREELFHAFVGNAYLAGFLGKQFVGDTCIGVLLLYQGRHSHHSRRFQGRAAGIAAHAYCHLRTELLDDAARFPLAACQFHQYGKVLPQVLAVEARHGQADNLVAGIGYTLHFHAAFCTYEQDFRIRTQFLNRVGNGHGRENVSARAATADDNARLVVLCFHI